MEPEIPPPLETLPAAKNEQAASTLEPAAPAWGERVFCCVNRALFGDQGLRAGWSVALFLILMIVLGVILGNIFVSLRLISNKSSFTAS
jgi:hypothetical protein